jgi:hypothetical protein
MEGMDLRKQLLFLHLGMKQSRYHIKWQYNASIIKAL